MRLAFLIGLGLLISACSLAPKYHQPEMVIPANYKESGKWLETTGKQLSLNRPWWDLYHDQMLSDLEARVDCQNQTIKAAFDRYLAAKATAAEARSALYPTINGVSDVNRQQTSGNVANKATAPIYSDMLVGAELSYIVDVWGRVKNNVIANESLAKASFADAASITLSMHADLASNYFLMRGAEHSAHVLNETVAAYEKALSLTRHLHDGGAASIQDVYQAETQLYNAKTLSADMLLKRAQYEHAIAVLVGEAPSNFTIPMRLKAFKPVYITPTIPSALLNQRPDILAAEQRVKAANASIGVARAAFFPNINLFGNMGLESAMISNLAKMPSLFWSIGPSATLVLIDGGRLQAILNRTNAQYYETVANYRQTVLLAYQDVEDNLVAIKQLDRERHTQSAATKAAYSALEQSKYRYKGGVAPYLDVVVSQNSALTTELSLVDINTRRQVASVQLIKALGGGW